MSERGTFVAEGIERIQNAMDSVGEEFEKLHKTVQKRRDHLEQEAWKRFGWIEKGTRTQVERARMQLRKSPLVQRAEIVRRDFSKRLNDRLEGLFSLLPYARQREVEALERKMAQLTRKLNKLEKASKETKSQPPRKAPPASTPPF